jgi:hypothetical protein
MYVDNSGAVIGIAVMLSGNDRKNPNIKVSFSSNTSKGFYGNWVADNSAFLSLINSALKGGSGVFNYYNVQYSRSNFLKYLKEQGASAFKVVPGKNYSCVRASRGGYELEIRAQVDEQKESSTDSSGKPVTVGGSIGIYLNDPNGEEEITAKKIQVTANTISEISGAASVIANVIKRGLTRYLSSLADVESGSVEEAIGTAVEAASEEIGSEIGLEFAIESLSLVEFIGIAVAVIALLLILFFALVKTMTHQLTVFNMTDYDIEYEITYLHNSIPLQNHQGILPKMNSVKDSLIPLGGGVTYNLASKTSLFLRNKEENRGLGYVIAFRCQGSEFTLLGDIPSLGQNSFLIKPGYMGGEHFFNEITGGDNPFKRNKAHKTLRLSEGFGLISATLANDQLSGETNYAGYSGYNYCSLLYIENS